ncbi:MAG: RND transporter [Gammaproteobacteria bacterium SG8_11]|nr:MAG: RND transporter [Gammaproteobacteria bacterium SG8_11]
MKLLDSIPLAPLVVFGIFLALAPFYPQPHLLEKIQMLFNGELSKPVDIFDLFWHSVGLILIGLKLLRMQQLKKQSS